MLPAPTNEADRAWLATLCVLYVEDDDVTRELLARYLRRRVGRVLVASGGAEGLATFEAERPAIVITDIQMPGMDGLALAEEIRRRDAGVPIVVTTAFEQIGYLARSIEAGIDKYVTKPIDTDKLEAALLACARRHRAEALLEQAHRQELEAARAHEREALGLLAGGLAHDFNNLLQTILGNIDLALPLTEAGTELHELLEAAMEGARQAADLGRKLNTLSESWSMDARPRPIGPTLQAALASALAGSKVQVHLEIPPDLPEAVHDVELLGRAFAQLARNAREAMGDAGSLHVSADVRSPGDGETPPLEDGCYLRIVFRDTGPGISPAALPRVFDPYFTTKRRGSVRGTGLGLSLCAAIVRRHRGAVTAASRGDRGAELTVWLPAATPDIVD